MDRRELELGGFIALCDFFDEKICRKKMGIRMDEDFVLHFGYTEEERENVLAHFGTPRHSGRYPWGSGEHPYQRYANFLGHVTRMRERGWDDNEIAKSMKMTSTVFRAKLSYAEDQSRKERVSQAQKLRDKGYSLQAIADRMGLPNESSVRSLLNAKAKARSLQTDITIDTLKKAVEESRYVDVGGGSEKRLGISETKLKNAVILMEEMGYKVTPIYQVQQGTGHRTTVRILTKDDVPYAEIRQNKEQASIPGYQSEDHGYTMEKIEPPKPIDASRIMVRYAEEGGLDRDGTIQLRRGVEDLSLNSALYAQVRIAAKADPNSSEPTHYLKGMALYGDDKDFPPGVDVIFNTNKPAGTEVFGKTSDTSVLKPIKPGSDPVNPFGATIRYDEDLIMAQRHYIDKNGERQLSCLNVVNEEGNWGEWSKNLSSQFLSKQKPELIKSQLKEAYDARKEDFDEIASLNNPVVKELLAKSFADDCDSAAVHLKGAALPRQRTQVLIPLPDLKKDECFAPNFQDGETVVLIRYPHAGPFEIAELKVNNRNAEGQKTLRRDDGTYAKDAIGIPPSAAQKLSGADFDGDTVIVIPNNDKRIKSMPALDGLKNFSTDEYKLPDDAPPSDSAHGFHKQMEMGKVSNLITDMTIKGDANYDEIARAVRHSMVVIDAEKHHLDWKQSELDNGILELKAKYQGGPTKGASTLISKASSDVRGIPARRLVTNPDRMTPEQRERFERGEKIYEETGRTYQKLNKETGEWETHKSTTDSSKMAEAFNSGKDAYSLSSGTVQETIYADFANKLNHLGNEARKLVYFHDDFKYNPSAAKTYEAEVKSLKDKLYIAELNRPLERKAHMLAEKWVKIATENDPSMDKDAIKKLRGRKLTEARTRIGAKKTLVDITPKEWEAIQARAITRTTLVKILNNADLDKVKSYALPRSNHGLSDSKVARARTMMKRGATTAEAAEALGVSVSTLQKALYS